MESTTSSFTPRRPPTSATRRSRSPTRRSSTRGGLFVYFGTGTTGSTLVDPNYLLLQRPANVGLPVSGSRFGRMCARINQWRNTSTGLLEPGLLIAEMDASDFYGNGIVHLVRLPLPHPAQPLMPWSPAPISNTWGALPLMEPAPSDPYEAGEDHLFGSMIIPLDYKGNQALFPGQQFIVTSRQEEIHVGGGVIRQQAGRAFPFVPPGS